MQVELNQETVNSLISAALSQPPTPSNGGPARLEALREASTLMDNPDMYCIIRSNNAGVFCGFVHNIFSDSNLILRESRRIFRWAIKDRKGISNGEIGIHGLDKGEGTRICHVEPYKYIEFIEITPCLPDRIKELREWEATTGHDN